ncbi:MAG: class I SAM-dependent methyltransferase [Cyanothece sp. SIO1E1]|nr:class I SAM-dependent methyltransferase [Cyanothece sp. SIO1E1]
MTATTKPAPTLVTQLINGLLAIRPLANLAKQKARNMMIERAESIGVNWRQAAKALKSRGKEAELASEWAIELAQLTNPQLTYPDYYLQPFHAYEQGNLSWDAATEVEVAAHAVHARIWPDAGVKGDAMLRQSYHDALQTHIPTAPRDIVDLGCGVGMSTFTLQALYPQAQLTGVDLSPYFLAVAQYQAQQRREKLERRLEATSPKLKTPPATIEWVHAMAESTGLPAASYDLVSVCLVYHELPQTAAIAILKEARRLLRSGGHLAIMDMNPKSEVFATMPPYVLTLLKSTEPYLDEYFALDLEQAIAAAGFAQSSITCNSPRHRTLVAAVQ